MPTATTRVTLLVPTAVVLLMRVLVLVLVLVLVMVVVVRRGALLSRSQW
jgi:hypothetical protein